MGQRKYLAIDFGAGSGRAVLGSLSNKRLVLEEVHRFPNKLINIHGSFYWDIFYLYDELITGIRKTIRKRHTEITSIAVDTWGVDFGLITKDNQLLNTPFSYRDPRTDGMLNKAFQLMPKDEIYRLTGNQFMQFNTVFQLLSMVKTKDYLLKSADKLLFLPDLFNFLLTGEKKSEYTIASTSQLLNAKRKKWETKIFSNLRIPESLMLDIVKPGTKIGKLHTSLRDTLGIQDIDVIAVGSHDTASAVAAVPNITENWAFISSGTWSLIGIETNHPIINKKSLKYNFTNEGGVGGKIRFLRNVMGMWIIQQLKKDWAIEGKEYFFSQINKMAQKASPFKCFIDVDAPEFLNPKNMKEEIIEFCYRTGQNPPKTQGEYIRSILESLAFKYRQIFDQLNQFAITEINKIHIVGGGSRNELLNQFTANATGINIIAGPVEATAFGNIMVQAIANGHIKDLNEGRKIIRNSISSSHYSPRNKSAWNKAYNSFKLILVDNF